MIPYFLSNKNLQELVKALKINDAQKSFLLNELPQMNGKERLELLDMLKKVFVLDKEESQAIKKIKDNWLKAS